MAVSAPALREALVDVVGREHVVADGRQLEAAAVDGVVPRWVVHAHTEHDVSRLLAVATSERLAVAPRGSGSSQGLGSPPRQLDLVLDLSRLDAVTEYVAEDMVASVEAGMALGALGARLSPRRQRLALDPYGGEARTIGGVLACNASGPLRFRYGAGRDLLLGVRFVQANGTMTWGGAKVVKSVTGYDVPKLLVGSLGTLGVIVGATLRLHPLPPSSASWLCAFDASPAAQDFLAALLASPLEPERVSVLNARAALECGVPSAGPAMLVSIASDEQAVAAQGEVLAEHVRRAGGRVEPLGAAAWGTLHTPLDAPVVLKLAGEPRRIIAWLDRAESLARAVAIEIAAVGQGGNGVLHLALHGVTRGAQLADALVHPLRAELAGEGGSVVVERAPAAVKAHVDVWGPVERDALAIMGRLKREFDPEGVLNHGRFVGGL
jgi:glycolate oxidase FAD binding subunit